MFLFILKLDFILDTSQLLRVFRLASRFDTFRSFLNGRLISRRFWSWFVYLFRSRTNLICLSLRYSFINFRFHYDIQVPNLTMQLIIDAFQTFNFQIVWILSVFLKHLLMWINDFDLIMDFDYVGLFVSDKI